MLQTTSIRPSSPSSPIRKDADKRVRPPLLEQVLGGAFLGIPILATALALVLLFLYGMSMTSLVSFIVMYAVTGFGIGIGYHRLGSHNSFKTPKLVRALLAVFGSMATQGPLFYWVAIHRRHHAFADQEGDPHSPLLHGKGLRGLLLGLWHAHFGWFFEMHSNMVGVYSTKVAREHEDTNWERYIPDLLRDSMLVWVNRLYFVWVLLGLVLPPALAYAATGSGTEAALAFLWGGLVRMCLVQQVTALIASLAHVYGTAPFRTTDGSRNSFLSSIVTFGDGWHNNHHAFPSSAWHGLHWWQIDMSGWLITLLSLFGLAWDIKLPNSRAMEAARKA